MRAAAIDVGSNTLRMLIAECSADAIQPGLYRQQITRLGGGYREGQGLSQESIERTLEAVADFIAGLEKHQIEHFRMVGTAILRRAENARHLVNLIKLRTRQHLEIISGGEEARLTASGVLSILDPLPENSLIIDIGGGSTELILCAGQKILFCKSYPVGVVQLCEEMSDPSVRQQHLANMAVKFSTDMLYAGITREQLERCELVGTAGTMTTLAAVALKLVNYERSRVNNHLLTFSWLEETLDRLRCLTIAEREQLPGLEPGRGDLIVPGLELIIALCRYLNKPVIRISDAGLLEGLLLEFC